MKNLKILVILLSTLVTANITNAADTSRSKNMLTIEFYKEYGRFPFGTEIIPGLKEELMLELGLQKPENPIAKDKPEEKRKK